MKRCLKCNINVGGNHEMCPLCQNRLVGTGEVSYFPSITEFRKKLLAYKLQLFISILIIAVAIMLDVLIGLNGGVHWSYLVILWLGVGQIVVRMLMKKHSRFIFFLADISLALIILISISSYYIGIGEFCLSYIVPSIVMAVVATEFAFALGDKKNIVMPYFLGGVVISFIITFISKALKGVNPVLWNISIIVNILVILGIIIFKGPKVLVEFKKRFHV